MIDVYNNETNELIGTITEADLQVLADHLEEESLDDQDYFIDQATLDVIGDGQATEHLMGILRKALGTSAGLDLRGQRGGGGGAAGRPPPRSTRVVSTGSSSALKASTSTRCMPAWSDRTGPR